MFSLKTKTVLSVLLSMSILVFIACKKDNASLPADPVATYLNLPETPFNYANPSVPLYLTAPPIVGQINTPPANPITDWGASLGRVLFYDNNLSKNKTISCSSCHNQANSFSDPLKLSKGFSGGLTGRHSMSLVNAMYYPNGRFFWDQRAATLEAQVLMPIQDVVEMGVTLDTLTKRVQSLPYYPTLFTKAFGGTTINSTLISQALAQFVRSIISYQSKFDIGRNTFPAAAPPPPNAPFPNFTAQENRGMQIFTTGIGGCNPCHGTETFTALQEKNNGLDLVTTDRGFGAVINNTNRDGLFKVGSLRNIELTAPYMHDGRFNTLEEVVEHYSSGVKKHPNLSPQLVLPNGEPRLANLTAADKAALVAFLKTLTDISVTTDVKYSNPFK